VELIVNKNGFVKSFIPIGFLILIGVLIGLYYLHLKIDLLNGEEVKSLLSFTSSLNEKDISKRLNSFPIYPNAKFLKKEATKGCVKTKEGESLCNLNIFVFKSKDDLKKIQQWYFENHGASGWYCDMGANKLEIDYSLNERQCDNEKLSLTFFLVT
jgi:hypothetical protein